MSIFATIYNKQNRISSFTKKCQTRLRYSQISHLLKSRITPLTSILLVQCIEAQPCDPLTKCNNLSPGYECTDCPAGYKSPPVRGIGLEQAATNKQVGKIPAK